jgi:hypothetical protein
MQTVLVPSEPHDDGTPPPPENDILAALIADPCKVELHKIRNLGYAFKFRRVLPFPKPYAGLFAYGWDQMNFNHPLTKQLLQFSAAVTLVIAEQKIPPAQLGQLEDVWQLPDLGADELATPSKIEKIWDVIDRTRRLLIEFAVMGRLEDPIPLPSMHDFVPGTFLQNARNRQDNLLTWSINPKRRFGQPVTR